MEIIMLVFRIVKLWQRMLDYDLAGEEGSDVRRRL